MTKITESEKIKAFEKWNTEYEKEERISNRIGRRVGWHAACRWQEDREKGKKEEDGVLT